jgi:photosystem II stability/assembly factor-like uncharacterized protein
MKVTTWLGAALALCVQVAPAAELVGKAESAPQNWIAAGPWGGGATAVAVNPANPRMLLAGGRNSLVYRSLDAGETWTRLAFPRHFLGAVTALLFDASDTKHYLVGIDANGSPFSGLWATRDEGRTWTEQADLAGTPIHALTAWAKDSQVLAAGTAQGIWLSDDCGAKWRRVSKPWLHEMRVVTAVAFSPTDRNSIYAGTPHLPWKTSDGGESWQSIHEGMIDDSDIFSIYIDPHKPQRVVLSACSGIYHTETGGAPWTKFKGIPPTLRRTHAVHIDAAHPDVIYAGTTLGLLKSTDGLTFKLMNDLAILSMAFDPKVAARFYIAAEASGLWKTEDGGKTLRRIGEGFTTRRVGQIVRAGPRLYLTTLQDGDAGGLFSSDDRGTNWKLVADAELLGGQHFQFLTAHPANPNSLVLGNTDRLRRSLNAGKTWKDITVPGTASGRSGGEKGPARLQCLAAVAGAGAKGAVLLAGTSRGLFRSTDFGSTWVPAALTNIKIVQSLLGLTVAGQRVLARTGESLYLSGDAGVTWKPLGLLLSTSTIYDIALSPRADEAVLLATAQGLYRHEAGSMRWARIAGGLQDGTVSSVVWDGVTDKQVWCVQFGILYESLDSGKTWRPVFGSAIRDASIRKLWTDGAIAGRLLAITPDLGIFYLELKDRKKLE